MNRRVSDNSLERMNDAELKMYSMRQSLSYEASGDASFLALVEAAENVRAARMAADNPYTRPTETAPSKALAQAAT